MSRRRQEARMQGAGENELGFWREGQALAVLCLRSARSTVRSRRRQIGRLAAAGLDRAQAGGRPGPLCASWPRLRPAQCPRRWEAWTWADFTLMGRDQQTKKKKTKKQPCAAGPAPAPKLGRKRPRAEWLAADCLTTEIPFSYSILFQKHLNIVLLSFNFYLICTNVYII